MKSYTLQIAEKSKNFPEIDLKFNPVLCRKEQNCKVGESLEWFCEHRAKRPRQREEEEKEEEKKSGYFFHFIFRLFYLFVLIHGTHIHGTHIFCTTVPILCCDRKITIF